VLQVNVMEVMGHQTMRIAGLENEVQRLQIELAQAHEKIKKLEAGNADQVPQDTKPIEMPHR